jgi:transglutaminase-like putative cysteine protease
MTVSDSIALRPAPRETAIELVDSWDAFLTGPAIDQAIGDPASITSLRLLVRAPNDLMIPDLPRQKVSAQPAGERLVELRAAPGGEVTAEERAEALSPSASIDSDSSEIRRAAADITKSLTTPQAKAEALLTYVFKTLTKTYQTNLSTATHVLRRKAGDCSEHAMLFVALARAAGIPAREVSGLVYTDVDQRFGWHAWVEVEIDGRWQPMDPVFGQRVADATHLALSMGTDAQWLKGLDRMQIRVAPQ